MTRLMKPICLLLFLTVVFSACTYAGATGDPITGTVLGFQNDNVLIEEDETKTQYEIVITLDTKLTGADSFGQGLRVEIPSFRLDESSSPAKIHTDLVKGLETWPTYIGFVLDVIKSDDGSYQFKMKTVEGTEFFVRVKEHTDVEKYVEKAAKIILENGAPVPADSEVIDVRRCPLLEVYHGTVTKVQPSYIEMEKSAGYENDGMPKKLKLSLVEETRINGEIDEGQAYTVAFDQHTLTAYGIVLESQ